MWDKEGALYVWITGNSKYLKHRYLKVPSYIKEYSGDTFRNSFHSSTSNYSYPKVTLGRFIGRVSSWYLELEVHFKLLISQSKFSGTRKFTLRYHLFEMDFDLEISRADSTSVIDTEGKNICLNYLFASVSSAIFRSCLTELFRTFLMWFSVSMANWAES